MTNEKAYTFDPNRFVIDSHRGAFKEGILENSIPAFMQSLREGANVLECDLRMSGDGHIVLIHNRTIDHIASHAIEVPDFEEFKEKPTGPVKSHSLAYLKALKFKDGAEILTLPELLRFMKEYRMGAQLELKENCESRILEDIAEAELPYDEMLGPVVITSFNLLWVRRLQKKARSYNIPLYDYKGTPGLAFGFQAIALGSFYGKYMIRKLGQWGIWGGMTHYRYMPINRIEYAHKYGIKFCPRVPDDPALIEAYIDAGVDGFETDNVPLIREIAQKKGIELWDPPKV